MNEPKQAIEKPGTAYLKLMRKWRKSYVDRIPKKHAFLNFSLAPRVRIVLQAFTHVTVEQDILQN